MPEEIPRWIAELNEEDLHFIRRFVLASGSLKQMASEYAVSYPTVRARLDRLITKVQTAEREEPLDPLERKVRLLVADGWISPELGKELLKAHRQCLKPKQT